jgi:hypothetical protein
MPPVRAVAPVGLIERSHPIEMLVDRLPHLPRKDRGHGATAETAVPLAPLQSLRLHALHEIESPR